MGFAGQLRIEHSVVVFGIACCFGPRRARQFIDLLMPFFIAGLVHHDSTAAPVRSRQRRGDRSHRGPMCTSSRRAVLPASRPRWRGRSPRIEFFAAHHTAWVDVLTAFPYLTYIFEAVALAVVFFFVDKTRCLRLGWVFMAVNLAGMLTEMFFRVAPPWYVSQYGLGPVVANVAASPAATIRFDQLTGTHLFQSFYGRSTDVFGAMRRPCTSPIRSSSTSTCASSACVGSPRRPSSTRSSWRSPRSISSITT